MRYEIFFKFLSSDYHFLDQASQSKIVVNMIWHKVGSLLLVIITYHYLFFCPFVFRSSHRQLQWCSCSIFMSFRLFSFCFQFSTPSVIFLCCLFVVIVAANFFVLSAVWPHGHRSRMNYFIKQLAIAGRFS
jgi:chromate transport protein ChrA